MRSRLLLLTGLLSFLAGAAFGQSPPTLSVSPPSPSTFGQTVTLTAGNISSFTSTVTFFDGSSTLGSSSRNPQTATATFSTSTLAVGTHSLGACVPGDGSPVCSSFVTYVVNPQPVQTTTRLTFAPNPPLGCQAFTLTATVTAATGTPTGTVTFFDGTNTLGTQSLSAGVATFTISSLTPGQHNFQAQYNGDIGYNKSSDLTGSLSVQSSVTVTVASSLNPSTFGQNVTFTATVTAASCGTATPVTGTVQFLDNGAPIGTGTISGGSAALTTSTLAVGTHPIVARYLGDTNYAPADSTNPLQQVVNNKANSNTSLSVNPNPATTTQTVTLTATVTGGSGGSTPTGTVRFQDGSTVLGSPSLVNGVATLTISNVPAGTHPITAFYLGDNTYNSSNSNTVNLVVNSGKGTTTTSVSAAPNPANTGQTVTITATVTGTGGTGSPTGTVTFTDNGNPLPSATLNGTTATITTTFQTAGSHAIVAAYAGDNNFNGSNSNPFAETINQTASSTSLQVNPNPANVGQAVTLTATVTPSSATGTVQFLDSGSVIGQGNVSNGVATLQVSTFTVGTHSLTARYGGDSANPASTSSAVTLTVGKQNTTTTLATSANPVTTGQPLTLTATVTAPGGGTPTGSITFSDGGSQLQTVTLSGGQAQITTSSLSIGTHNLTASYSGDGNFNSSTSNAVPQVVNTTPQSSTSLVVTPTTANVGQTITMTATVTPSGATGTVAFTDNGSTLQAVQLSSGGTATFQTSSLSTGTHQIVAVYNGNATFNSSSSNTVTVTINGGQTSVAVIANPGTAAFGQIVTFTATVSGAGGAIPTGTVTFNEGNNQLSTPLTLNNGTASFSTSALTVGSHTIVASYSGSTTFSPSTGTATVTINKATTVTALTATPTNPTSGQGVLLTARVTPSTATGTVTFMDGTTALGSPVALVAGTAGFTISTLSNGSHSITAVYSGDANFLGSTSAPPTTVSVGLTGTTTTLTVSATSTTFGGPLTLTASVVPSTAAGTVTFLDGSASLGTGTLSNGTATLTTSALTAGTHSITARFEGNSQFGTSTSDPRTVTVAKVNSTTSLTATPNPSTSGQAVTLRATVTPSTATGTVTFQDGSTALGSPVTLSGGVATTTVSTLSVATHTLTATYNGDTNFNSSTSTAVSQVVNPNGTPLGTISPTTLSTAIVNVPFTQTFTVTGGTAPLTWTLTSGSVPGLTLNSSTGVLSGTPTTAGTTSLGIRVADNSTGPPATLTVSLTVLPLPSLAVSSPTINAITDQPVPQVTVNPPYTIPLTGTFTLTFQPNASNLPANFAAPDVKFANSSTPDGKTSPPISIPANSTAAIALPAVQVGSVAGTITIRLATLTTSTGQSVLPATAVVGTITVNKAAPVITAGSVKITTTSTGFSVSLQGVSTPRELTQANLTFLAASGATLNGTTNFVVQLTTDANAWFADNGTNRGVANGGKFALTMPFNYSGDITALASVSVTVSNNNGTSAAVVGVR